MFNIREEQIIQELLTNKVINSKDLSNCLNISLRQLTYSLSKINQELLSQNLLPILRNKKGEWKIEKESLDWLSSKTDSLLNINQVNRSNEEIVDSEHRLIFIIILILIYPNKIWVKNIENYIHVSRNTILSDLKRVNVLLKNVDLSLRYVPLKGYIIIGKEEDIKRLIVRMVNELMKTESKVILLDELITSIRNQVIHLITLIEKELGLKYSDTSFTTLFYTLSLSALYFERNMTKQLKEKSMLNDTDEYKILLKNLSKVDIIYRNESDIEWYCLLFLSSNTIQSKVSPEDPEIYMSIQKMITIFEQKTSMRIEKANYLSKRLFAHLRPAIYRMKYNIPIDDVNVIDMENIEYKAIFDVLKDSVGPIEKIVGKKLPLDEIKLISFYFGGELLNQKNQMIETKKRAIVVCSSGLIVAKLMMKSLTKIFPELNFVTSASVRDFYDYKDDYEVIFSTIPLQSSILEYVVEPLLNEEEKVRLRIKVLRDLMIEDISSETDEIMEIMKKNAIITNEHTLYDEINFYLANLKTSEIPNKNILIEDEYFPIDYYLKEEYITISNEYFSNWQQALNKACEPLLENGVISENYLNKLTEHLSDPNSYLFLNEKIAIPHSAPEHGVNKEACALLISRQPIVFPGNHKVNFVIPFALLDSNRHLYALNQVIFLSKNDILQKRLLECTSKTAVLNEIKRIDGGLK